MSHPQFDHFEEDSMALSYPTGRAEFDNKMRLVGAIDWARMAILIDSEGSINIHKQKSSIVGGTPRHTLQMNITGTSVALMNWLSATFGGYVYSVKGNYLSKKTIWRWCINSRCATCIVANCLPYMIVKKEQARLSLLLADNYSVSPGTGQGRVPTEIIVERENIMRAVSAANQAHDTDIPIDFQRRQDDLVI